MDIATSLVSHSRTTRRGVGAARADVTATAIALAPSIPRMPDAVILARFRGVDAEIPA